MSKRAFDKIKAGLDDAKAFLEGTAEKKGERHLVDASKKMVRNAPSKTVGEIGSTFVSVTPNGQRAKLIHRELPSSKEGLEKFFGEIFVNYFNSQKPLGDQVSISTFRQNETSDLDFSIECEIADYLELAELNPRSEEFGRHAYRTGRINVYDYARWIFFRIIKKKQRAYGVTSTRTLLLLYTTHWQFLPSQSVLECLTNLLQRSECKFAGVFILLTNGGDFTHARIVYPYRGPKLRPAKDFAAITTTNLQPGYDAWLIKP